jgi:hypothetical protein
MIRSVGGCEPGHSRSCGLGSRPCTRDFSDRKAAGPGTMKGKRMADRHVRRAAVLTLVAALTVLGAAAGCGDGAAPAPPWPKTVTLTTVGGNPDALVGPGLRLADGNVVTDGGDIAAYAFHKLELAAPSTDYRTPYCLQGVFGTLADVPTDRSVCRNAAAPGWSRTIFLRWLRAFPNDDDEAVPVGLSMLVEDAASRQVYRLRVLGHTRESELTAGTSAGTVTFEYEPVPAAAFVPATNLGGTVSWVGVADLYEGKERIVILSSRVYVDPELQQERWVAMIRHRGPGGALCDAMVTPTFYGANGEVLATFSAETIRAPAYMGGLLPPEFEGQGPYYCLQEGEVGVAQGTRMDGGHPLEATLVAEMRFTAVGTLRSDPVRADFVTVSDATMVAEGGGQVLRARLTNGNSALAFWRVHAFPKDTNGLPLAVFDLVKARQTAVAPGATWDLVTPAFTGAGPVSGFHLFVEHGPPQ